MTPSLSSSKFTTYLKPVLIGIGVLTVVLIAGIVIYAKLFLSAEMVEKTLSQAVQEQLRRPVSFRSIEIGFMQGIVLHGVTVGRSLAWETEDFFTCDEIALDYGFWPLLFRRLVIRSVALKNPHASLQSSGAVPFSIYGNTRPGARQAPELELILLPGSVLVEGGMIGIRDKKEHIGFELTGITVDAGSISYLLPFEISGHASFGGSGTEDIKLKATGFVPRQEFTIEVTVPDADLGQFRQFLALFGVPIKKGIADLKLALRSKGEEPMGLTAKIGLKDIGIEVLPPQKGDDDISLQDLTAELDLQADYDQISDTLDLKKIKGAFLSAPFAGSGSVRGISGGMPASAVLHVAADRLSLDELSNKISYGLLSPFKGLGLAGLIGLKVDLTGKKGDQFPIITLNLRGNRIVYPALGTVAPELNGTLTFDSRNITLTDLRLGTRSAGIVLAGTLGNYLYWPPQADIRVVSSDFNFYEFFNTPENQQGEDIGPLDFGALKFGGPLDLGDVQFLNLDLDGVQGAYAFEKSRFSITDFKGGIKQGGSFNLSTALNLAVKGFEYNTKLSIFDLPVQQLGELAGADLGHFMEGFVSGSFYLSGRGTKSTTFADNLAGDGSYRIKNCRIKNFIMPEQLDRYLRKDTLKEISFTDADLQIRLRRSAFEISGAFLSPKAELHPSGQIGLNMELNMQADLKLAPEVFSPETRMAEYLPRDGSWVALPFSITGTLDNPVITLTEDALQHIMQVTVPRLFMDMLEKSKQQGAASAQGPEGE